MVGAVMKKAIDDAVALCKAKRYTEAFSLFEKVTDKAQIFSDPSAKMYYLWSIYFAIIKQEEHVWKRDFDRIKESVTTILKHTKNSDQIYTLTVFKVIDYYESLPSINHQKVEQWIDMLNVELLSTKLMEPKIIKGRTVEFASDMEKWYMIKTKVCEELEKYHDCLKYSRKALEVISPLHYDNDVWFNRRIAISLAKLGKLDEAIKITQEIMNKRKDSFIYIDLGQFMHQKGDFEGAKDNLLKGIKKQKKIEFCIPALKTLIDIYSRENKKEISDIFMKVIIIAKTDNEWSLKKEESEYKYESNFEAKYPSRDSVLKAYEKIINESTLVTKPDPNKAYTKGVVKTLMPNGNAGFITTDDGESIYFNSSEIMIKPKFSILNSRVSFLTKDSFDKKKNRMSKTAFEIWVI
jgi:tetratricopeptide (TPR) repeat protein